MDIKLSSYYCFSVFSALIGLVGCQNIKEAKAEPEKPMNVLFIAVDDLRPELNFYGADHIRSPNLDALASESLVFNRAYCNIPTCGASRASIMTGMRPTRYRYLTHDVRVDEQAPEALTLPELFKQNGYTTISNGKVFHHKDDRSEAWDEIWKPKGKSPFYHDEENIELHSQEGKRGRPFEATDTDELDYVDGKIASKGIEDLQKLKNAGKPFFLAMGFMKPHLPFNAPQKYWDQYPMNTIELPESYLQPENIPSKAFHRFGELRNYHDIPKEGPLTDNMAKKLIQGYYACVSHVDAQIGRLLDKLDDLGLSGNTVVVLWGDHGWNLGEHKLWCKHCTFETALHSPLVVKVPGKTNGEYTDAITEFIDIYPSLAELAGFEVPQNQLQGESFVSLLEGREKEKDFAISKFNDAVTLIKDGFFYTEWTDDEGEPYERMLFDHSTDPLELNNLAEKAAYSDAVDSLSAQLHARWGKDFLKRTFGETDSE